MDAMISKIRMKKEVPPGLGETDGDGIKERMIHAHLFVAGCDWWLAEYDVADDMAFGFARLNGDDWNAEWGYIPISELREIKVAGVFPVEFDRHWVKKPAAEVDGIKVW